jgi:hypothetical protein
MHISYKEASHRCDLARNCIGFTVRDRVKVSAPFSVRCIRATATYEFVSLYSEPFFKFDSTGSEVRFCVSEIQSYSRILKLACEEVGKSKKWRRRVWG